MVIISIDNGNSNSYIAGLVGGTPKVYRAEGYPDGGIPSGIFVKDHRAQLNPLAKQMAMMNPECYVENYKRLIGSGQTIRVCDEDIMPESLMAMNIQSYTCLLADETGIDPMDVEVFVTVPVAWGMSTLNKIIEECRALGIRIDMRNVVSEATAAAVYVMKHSEIDLGGQTVMIFDLGGGTTDICVGEVVNENGVPKFVIEGEPKGLNLGGRDLDDIIHRHFIPLIEKELGMRWEDLSVKDRALIVSNIRTLKEELSTERSSTKTLRLKDGSGENKMLELSLTVGEYCDLVRRSEFIGKLKGLYEEMSSIADIDHVIITGRPWATPFLRSELDQWAPGKVIETDPFCAVVLGGMHYAQEIMACENRISTLVQDRCPFAVGAEVRGPDNQLCVDVHVTAGETRPTSYPDTYVVPENPADVLTVGIFKSPHTERISYNPLDGVKLGTLQIPRMDAKPGDKVEVTISFMIENRVHACARIGDRMYEVPIDF